MNPTQNLTATTSADELTVADILRCAACYLMANGWTQDEFYADADTHPALRHLSFPPADVLGAFMAAITGHRYDDPDMLRAEAGEDMYRTYTTVVDTFAGWLYLDQPELWLGEHFDIPDDAPHLIWSWNDHPDQDAATVVDTLTRASYELDHIAYGTHLAEFALYYAIIHGTAGGARWNKQIRNAAAEALQYAAMYLLIRGWHTYGRHATDPFTTYEIAPNYPAMTVPGAVAAWVQRHPMFTTTSDGRIVGEAIFRTAISAVARWVDDPQLRTPLTGHRDLFADYRTVHAWEVFRAGHNQEVIDALLIVAYDLDELEYEYDSNLDVWAALCATAQQVISDTAGGR